MPAEYLHHRSILFVVSGDRLSLPQRGEWVYIQAHHWSNPKPVRVTARRNCLTEFVARNPRLRLVVTVQSEHVLDWADDEHSLLLEISNG